MHRHAVAPLRRAATARCDAASRSLGAAGRGPRTALTRNPACLLPAHCSVTPSASAPPLPLCAAQEPKGREVADSDDFEFNEQFSAKQIRFKVQTIAAVKESDKEKTDTRQRVEEDRKPQVEAAIVRIMKSRKVLEHNLLIAEARAAPRIARSPRARCAAPARAHARSPPFVSLRASRRHLASVTTQRSHLRARARAPPRPCALLGLAGDAAAQVALPARPEHDQEADRVADRARVPRARQGRFASLQVPRVSEAARWRPPCTHDSVPSKRFGEKLHSTDRGLLKYVKKQS